MQKVFCQKHFNLNLLLSPDSTCFSLMKLPAQKNFSLCRLKSATSQGQELRSVCSPPKIVPTTFVLTPQTLLSVMGSSQILITAMTNTKLSSSFISDFFLLQLFSR